MTSRIFPDDGDRLMSIDKTAARLRTSPTIVGKLVKSGVLPCIRKYTMNAFLAQHDGEDSFDLIGDSQ